MIEIHPSNLSIIICTRNSDRTLRRCLASVHIEPIFNYEIVIVDGQSNDSTLSIIEEYKSKHRLKLVTSEPKGVYNAMNIGINNANPQYDFIYFLHSDDEIISSAFNYFLLSAVKIKTSAPTIFYSDIKYITSSGTEVHSNEKAFKKALCTLSHPACIFQKGVFESLNSTTYYNEQIRISSDALLFYTLNDNSIPFLKIDSAPIARMHDGGLSSYSTVSDQIDLYKIESKYLGKSHALARLVRNLTYSAISKIKKVI